MNFDSFPPIRWIYDKHTSKAYTSPRTLYESNGIWNAAGDHSWHHYGIMNDHDIVPGSGVHGWIVPETGENNYYGGIIVNPDQLQQAVKEAVGETWPELLPILKPATKWETPIPRETERLSWNFWPKQDEPVSDINEIPYPAENNGFYHRGGDEPFIYDFDTNTVHYSTGPAHHYQLSTAMMNNGYYPMHTLAGEWLRGTYPNKNFVQRVLLKGIGDPRVQFYPWNENERPPEQLKQWAKRRWPQANVRFSHEFLPEDEDYMHHDNTIYRWVLDSKGEVHFGLGDDYSHWDILRRMSTDAPNVDAMGYMKPSERKVSVSENYTYDDIPVIAGKVKDAFDRLVMHTAAIEGGIQEIQQGENFYNWQGKQYNFDPTFGDKKRKGFNAYIDGHLVGSVTYTVAPDHVKIESIYVVPDHRGTELAQELLDEIRQRYPGLQITGDWDEDSTMNQHAENYNFLVGKTAADGWRKWIYDPETGDYQEWEGPQPHHQIAKLVWPRKDLSQGNWWGGSHHQSGHAELYYTPPGMEYEQEYQLIPDEIKQNFKTSASNFFYISSWMRPMTRWIYFPDYHVLFARPFLDVFYTTHMQMLKDIFELYPNLKDEPWEGGYVTSTGQVNVTIPGPAPSGLEQALRAYNLEGQSAPLPH